MIAYVIYDNTTIDGVEIWTEPPYKGNYIMSVPVGFWRKHIKIPIRKNRVSKVKITPLKNGAKIEKY